MLMAYMVMWLKCATLYVSMYVFQIHLSHTKHACTQSKHTYLLILLLCSWLFGVSGWNHQQLQRATTLSLEH